MSFFNTGKHNLKLGEKTYVMGILNITPDSFSDGGKYNSPEKALKRAIEIQNEGADIIDIGAQSTRPGHVKISVSEEWERLHIILKLLKENIKIPISIDTFHPEIAKESLKYGVEIVNDVTGFENCKMINLATKNDFGLVVMHPNNNLDTKTFFYNKIKILNNLGIDSSRICLDPGIGFKQTRNLDYSILANLEKYKFKGHAMLVGASRKRIIGEVCDNPEFENRLYGSISAHVVAAMNGADIVRVHDVKEHVQAMKVLKKIKEEKNVPDNHRKF